MNTKSRTLESRNPRSVQSLVVAGLLAVLVMLAAHACGGAKDTASAMVDSLNADRAAQAAELASEVN